MQANFNPLRAQTAASLSPATASGANIYNLYTAQVQVAYTFDVWGLNRRTVESLQALADVQRFEVEAAYLALTSNVAVAAITEASLRGQIEATNQLIAINSKMLDIFQRRLDTGRQRQRRRRAGSRAGASQGDVAAAAQGAGAATRPPGGAVRRLYQRRTARDFPARQPAFAGRSAGEPAVANGRAAPGRARGGGTIALRQRQIGVATANLLPNFTISANGGYTNTVFAALISPQSLAWELAGNATQTIFDAGTLLHQLEGARDTYQAAAWTYRGTVIGAVQNVADALRALQNDADALRAARDFERAAKKSLDLAQQQLDKGQGNVLLQLTAEQTYLQANIQVVQAQAARLSDTAALFQALGGGWWNRIEPPVSKVLDVGTGQAEPIQQDAPPQ